jgi:Flp pilus assembly protein TadG
MSSVGGSAGSKEATKWPTAAIRKEGPTLRKERGAVTVYFVLFTLVFLGLLVMATDFGRMYLIQAELQTAADAAALAAATQLVGTANASLHAADQITASFDSTTGNDNRFNLRQNQIGIPAGLVASTEVSYFSTLADAQANLNAGQTSGIDWSSGVYPKYVRVQIAAQAPVLFVPFLNRMVNALPTITVSSVAGISAPMCTVCGVEGLAVVDPSAGTDAVNYGLVPGDFYTLYLTTTQQTPTAPVTPGLLDGTVGAVPYAILNHVPSGPPDLDLDALMFEMGAGGISRAPALTPPGNITAETVEVAYPDLVGNTAPGTTIGQDILCGLNARFGVDPAGNICGTFDGGEFADLSPFFNADSDVGGETYAAGFGLQDFAMEYDGSTRRILTMAVVDAVDSLNVLSFRQFLIEMSSTVTQGLDPSLVSGAFRAQYLGALVPLRCGGIGGVCTTSNGGVGRVVLH